MRLTITELEKQLKTLKFEVKFIEVILIGYFTINLLAFLGVLK